MRIQGDCDRSVGASGEARIELNRYNGLPQMRRGLDDFSRIAICRTRFGNARFDFGNVWRDGWVAQVSPRAVFGSGANGLVSLRSEDEKRCVRIDSKAFCPYGRYPNVPEEHKRA